LRLTIPHLNEASDPVAAGNPCFPAGSEIRLIGSIFRRGNRFIQRSIYKQRAKQQL